MMDTSAPQPIQPDQPESPIVIQLKMKLFKIVAATAVVILAIAGTTMGIITIVQLDHTQHVLTQTEAQLSSTQAQLSANQTKVQCMSPTINYLSQFNGSYGLNSTDGFGNVTGTWYMPATNTGQPADNGRSQMGTC